MATQSIAASVSMIRRSTRLSSPSDGRSGGRGGVGALAFAPRRKTRVSCSVDGGKNKGVPNSNYVVPLDGSFSSSITRPLFEILRDLNKKVPDNIVKSQPPRSYSSSSSSFIPWYHANRMLSFYAPGWCGEVRDVIFSDNGRVTVVYRLTIRGSDEEAFRDATGTASSVDGEFGDPVAAAEEIAFCRACARFGLGLYLYHED